MDYDQFWLDLNEANSNDIAEWKLEYSFKDFYGAEDFSPKEFQGILDKMKIEDDFFKQYFAANSVQKVDYECDEVCKAYHICTIAEQDYGQFEVCIKNESPTTTENPDFSTSENPKSTTENPDLSTTENTDISTSANPKSITENPDSTTTPNGSSRFVFDFFAILFLISLSL